MVFNIGVSTVFNIGVIGKVIIATVLVGKTVVMATVPIGFVIGGNIVGAKTFQLPLFCEASFWPVFFILNFS